MIYLSEQKGITMGRRRLDEVPLCEGLCWRRHETWFGERVDPDFAEKGVNKQLYTTPPVGSVVMCLEEMGP